MPAHKNATGKRPAPYCFRKSEFAGTKKQVRNIPQEKEYKNMSVEAVSSEGLIPTPRNTIPRILFITRAGLKKGFFRIGKVEQTFG